MSRQERAQRAAKLRYAIVMMTIRYGSSIQHTGYADAAGKYDVGERHRRAADRQFTAIKRLTDALTTLAEGSAR